MFGNIPWFYFLIAAAGVWWFFHINTKGDIHASKMKDLEDKEAAQRFQRMVNTKGDGTAKISKDKRRTRSFFASDESGNIFYAEKEKGKKK
jgi:hypothetical protein